jgi:ferritin-like metal-binding protein YciE
MDSIRDLLVDEMKDLYDAEKQLVKAIPKVAKASSNPDLREGFEKHLHETRGHVERLERAFELLGEKAASKPCAAMRGLVEEAGQTTEAKIADDLADSAIICAAQKIEHYEIAGYGTLVAWARALNLDDVAELLEATLKEEKAADQKLSEVADEILSDAASALGDVDDQQKHLGAAAGAEDTHRKKVNSKGGEHSSRRRAG